MTTNTYYVAYSAKKMCWQIKFNADGVTGKVIESSFPSKEAAQARCDEMNEEIGDE